MGLEPLEGIKGGAQLGSGQVRLAGTAESFAERELHPGQVEGPVLDSGDGQGLGEAIDGGGVVSGHHGRRTPDEQVEVRRLGRDAGGPERGDVGRRPGVATGPHRRLDEIHA